MACWRTSGSFPYPLIDLVAVGEETGKLPVTLEAAGRLLKQDVDSSPATVISLIEPLLMLVLGGIVACIVMDVRAHLPGDAAAAWM